jgi:hypothetical protein
MSEIRTGEKTFTAGEDLEARRLVKVKSGTSESPPEVMYADDADTPIGVTEYAVDSGDPVAIRLLNDAGTFLIEASVGSAIAVMDSLYVANDGKVTEVASGTAYFQAAEAGSDGAHLECIRLP